MTRDLSEQLSAYIDGELGQVEMSAVALRLETDANARAEHERLKAADALALAMFDKDISEPVSLDLVKSIKAATLEMPAPDVSKATPRPMWLSLAAGLVLLGISGFAGYQFDQPAASDAPARTWLTDVADYHAIYAGQQRHLVEVDASESEHIEAWLGKTTGVTFSIPDMTSLGLQFEGGRLVVANRKPVAQLMYRLADGTVVALCLQASDKVQQAEITFVSRTIGDFDFISWTNAGADYVVIAPPNITDLTAVAQAAAATI